MELEVDSEKSGSSKPSSVTQFWINIEHDIRFQMVGIHLLDSDRGRCPDTQILQKHWIKRINGRKATRIFRHEFDQP